MFVNIDLDDDAHEFIESKYIHQVQLLIVDKRHVQFCTYYSTIHVATYPKLP